AQRTPKKMIQIALRSALSDRASGGRVALVDAWSFDGPSTKAAIATLADLGLSGRVLLVLGDEDGYTDRSFANLPEVQTMLVGELNAYDVLVNDWVVFTDATLPGGAGSPVDDEPAGADDPTEPAGDEGGGP
ncbi:MAG: 50S ribosomal protein L4, partial [Acidimicrobiales bacterium]